MKPSEEMMHLFAVLKTTREQLAGMREYNALIVAKIVNCMCVEFEGWRMFVAKKEDNNYNRTFLFHPSIDVQPWRESFDQSAFENWLESINDSLYCELPENPLETL